MYPYERNLFGTVALYRNGQLIWSLTGNFDLSRNKMDFEENSDIHREVTVSGLPVVAGSVYRLEVDIDGYPKAIAG